jgi:hypothetical protein
VHFAGIIFQPKCTLYFVLGRYLILARKRFRSTTPNPSQDAMQRNSCLPPIDVRRGYVYHSLLSVLCTGLCWLPERGQNASDAAQRQGPRAVRADRWLLRSFRGH